MMRLIAAIVAVCLFTGSLYAGRAERQERRANRKEARAAQLTIEAQGHYARAATYGSAGGYVESSFSYGSDGGAVETYSSTRMYRAPVLVKVCRNGVCRYEYR